MSFLHFGYFPVNACPIEGSPPSGDEGLEYPFGMSLEDFMELFWKVDSFSASGSDLYYLSGTGFGTISDSATYGSTTAGYLPGSGMSSLVCNTVSRTFLFAAEVTYDYDPGIYPGTAENFVATQEGRARMRILEPTYVSDDTYYPRIILDIKTWYGEYGSIGSSAFSEKRDGNFVLELSNNTYTTEIGLNSGDWDGPPAWEADLTITAESTRPAS